MPLLRRRREPLDVLRARIIHETESALLYGLLSPGQAVRIPTVEVGKSRFDPAFAAKFWAETLGIEDTELATLNPRHFERSTSRG